MLDIENTEELEVAQKAIEEYRKTRVRHVGIHATRMKLDCEQSIRERAFAKRWQSENQRGSVLAHLLNTAPGKNEKVRDYSPEEATAAATVIQWLGTNVGWCFLCECINDAGYSQPVDLKPNGWKKYASNFDASKFEKIL